MTGSKRLYLTERDVALLTALGRTLFLSSRELEALFFAPNGSGWACGYASYRVKRLRQLTEHGLLLAWQTAPRTHRLYALTLIGKKRRVAHADILPARLRAFTSAALPPAPPIHFRLLAQSHAALLTTLQSETVVLADYRGEHTFLGAGNFDRVPAPDTGERLPVVPDGLAVLRRLDGKARMVFIEADTGSEALATIARKVRAYVGYTGEYGTELFRLRFDAPPVFTLIFVTRSPRRRDNVARTVTATLQYLGLTSRRYLVCTLDTLPETWAQLLR